MSVSFGFGRGLGLVAALGVAGLAVEAVYAQPRGPETEKAVKAAKVGEAAAPASDIEKFCASNAAIVGDARLTWQTARLREVEAQVQQRLREIEAKTAELVAWMRKRDEAMRAATDSIVAIYARMRPDSAAQQLAAMEDAMAAAVLAKLPSRSAGVILNEMESGRAARLTRVMVGPDAGQDGKRS
jgi:flagellar motility protein MotE (MotC chaperone)